MKRLVQQHIERVSRRAVLQARQKIVSSDQQAAMEVEEGEITESNSKDMDSDTDADVDIGTKKEAQNLPFKDSRAEKRAKADKTSLPKFTNINW